jgi:hypothetical protein
MQSRGYPCHPILAIQEAYQNNIIVAHLVGKILEEVKVNQGVRQGYSLSPTLFNIYIETW